MTLPTSAWRGSLDRIRAEGRTLGVPELAVRLLRLAGAPPAALARRLLAAALDCSAEALPERLEPSDLNALRHGLLRRPAGAPDSSGAAPRSRAELRIEELAYTVVDLETTGLSADGAAILEIGAVRVERLRPTARFATLVDPGGAIPASITRLTGIDAALVSGAPGTAVAVPALRRWLAHTPDAAFVAHNAGFDLRFLARAFERAELPPLPGPVLCTRRLGRRLVPALDRFDLDTLCARFGVANRARHRALGDADAAAHVLVELVALARAEGVATLGELVELQQRPIRRRARGRRRTRRRPVRAAERG